ncbi:hypothetical protein ROZALSC1DRAFT_29759 [Rozella allomycis CSF55]|uniref:Uncharacterized protein n=1 Tax=Rozella allomycis (strain CSF55) TaxID=988480 RepID=A0A4V1IZM4_ROZAC|nr:hypothetical protein ROZALSC1DRAFT_29759 [Rozella allomycis CSF55]
MSENSTAASKDSSDSNNTKEHAENFVYLNNKPFASESQLQSYTHEAKETRTKYNYNFKVPDNSSMTNSSSAFSIPSVIQHKRKTSLPNDGDSTLANLLISKGKSGKSTPIPENIATFSDSLVSKVIRSGKSTPVAYYSSPETKWQNISNAVISLFNGEGLKTPIETTNNTLSSLIIDVGIEIIIEDAFQLIEQGILTFSFKLSNTNEDQLLLRLSEIWAFFYGTVIPLLQVT